VDVHHPVWFHALQAIRPVLIVVCASASGFYVYALYSARDVWRCKPRARNGTGELPVSVLKPLRGLDREAAENFASFCLQDYGRWEIVFGAEDESEPSLEAARRVAREHPEADISIVIGPLVPGANPKVRMLAKLAAAAKYPLLLVSDSDIRAGRSHLRNMVGPLSDPKVGVVTCLYRTSGTGFIGTLDSLALTTEFLPGALVARQLEGMSFAMGAGILIRREVLAEIGGFAAIERGLADDYMLGRLPAAAGHRVELACDVVDHQLGTKDLKDLNARQTRWNLGIRTSRPWGYAGLVFTQGTAAALFFLLATGGSALGWSVAGATLAVRLGAAWFLAARCLHDKSVGRLLWLVPFRDLVGTLFWLKTFFGSTVVWRGRRFRVGAEGRILDTAP
jgi:ceramide glucosyltransferase